MEVRFTRRTDGVVDVHLTDDWRPLEDTLQDAVTTRAPAGGDEVNPSTFWIDRTLTAIELELNHTIVASGNATDLVLHGDELVAHSHYEMFDDQHVARRELVELLKRWRAVVLDHHICSPQVT